MGDCKPEISRVGFEPSIADFIMEPPLPQNIVLQNKNEQLAVFRRFTENKLGNVPVVRVEGDSTQLLVPTHDFPNRRTTETPVQCAIAGEYEAPVGYDVNISSDKV